SFGADLTPFILNNLSSTLRNQISEVILLSPSRKGELKIDLMTLLFPTHSGELDIVSEINKLKLPVTVILNDHDSFADSDFREGLTVKRLPGNHHFNGQYKRVVETMVELMAPSQQLKG
ncbi:MAG: AcvB/VirJ family lysyl-phosphatidylglycerol hydrolase, partial [Bacteroidota bacterium]|nr:AcvB/VirJ family lysyl-phosphatidylglycerol hydrolase [Bacteroidota bacterium]